MALDKTDLEYIKNTIEWLNEHTELIDSNRTNCEMLYNSVQNSLQALESALAEYSIEAKATLPINSVMPRFLEKWFDSVRGYWICPKCKHKPIFAWVDNAKSGDKHYCKHCKWTYEVP